MLTKQEFDQIVEDGKMFQVTDMFYGTIDQFEDSFFSNVTYDQVVDFAIENESELLAYTDDDHKEWVKLHETSMD